MEDGFEVVNLHGCASGVIPTPTIGTNGNWYIGNKDTGVCAKGVAGETGPQGPKGDSGLATLIWTNSAPTSHFAEQTIEASLSEYEFIEIIAYTNGNSTKIPNVVGNKGDLIRVDFQSNNIYFGTRKIEITSNGILLSGGSYGTFNSMVANNGAVVPYKILGYK